MVDFIVKYATLILENWQEALLGGIIVVSAVIFVMGILKKIAFDKIPNKLVRKISLAFSSIALSLPATALYFIGDSISFDHYWVGSVLNAFATIITYWLYENTGLRNGIHFIGKNVVIKFIKFIAANIVKPKNGKESAELFKAETANLKKSVGDSVANSLSKFASDYEEDDLKNL